jgi:hypothetical protein
MSAKASGYIKFRKHVSDRFLSPIHPDPHTQLKRMANPIPPPNDIMNRENGAQHPNKQPIPIMQAFDDE